MIGLNGFLRDALCALGGFTLFLLAVRLLPDFARNLTILIVSVAAIEIFTTPFFTFGLIAVTGIVYYGLFWLQWNPKRAIYCRLIAGGIVVLFFLLKDLPWMATPWTGPYVHLFGVTMLALRLLTVTADVGRGRTLPTDPLEFFVYAFFFPTFFLGPLERLDEFRINLTSEKRPLLSGSEAGSHLIRLAVGLGKGWLVLRFLPSNVSEIAAAFRSPNVGQWYLAALGGYAGVSAAFDLVVGAAGLAGYRISENLENACFQSDPKRFWRAWFAPVHRFFAENVYRPIGGNKLLLLHSLVVFVVAGLSLRLGVGSCLWAVWNVLGLGLWRLLAGKKSLPKGLALASWIVTLHWVGYGWVLFFRY